MKINQMRKAKGFYSVCYSQEVSHYHLCFGRDSKAGRGVGSVMAGKREGFGCTLIVAGGQHQHQEAGGRPTRNGTSHVTG